MRRDFAIQNNVISAGENEAAGVETMKFFEVAPHLAMTEHAITIRPICFSGKTFKKLPADLQAAILKAGKEAGVFGRQIESGADTAKLELAPQAPGLAAVSLGLSRIFPDDHEMLEHGFVIYDALYTWSKDVRAERHTWNPQRVVA